MLYLSGFLKHLILDDFTLKFIFMDNSTNCTFQKKIFFKEHAKAGVLIMSDEDCIPNLKRPKTSVNNKNELTK